MIKKFQNGIFTFIYVFLGIQILLILISATIFSDWGDPFTHLKKMQIWLDTGLFVEFDGCTWIGNQSIPITNCSSTLDYEALNSNEKSYGPLYQIYLHLLMTFINVENFDKLNFTYSVIFYRNLINIISSFFILYIFLNLVNKLFKNKFISLLVPLFIFSIPIFTETIVYDTKNVPIFIGLSIYQLMVARLLQENLIKNIFKTKEFWITILGILLAIGTRPTSLIFIFFFMFISFFFLAYKFKIDFSLTYVSYTFLISLFLLALILSEYNVIDWLRNSILNTPYYEWTGIQYTNGILHSGTNAPRLYNFFWIFYSVSIFSWIVIFAGLISFIFIFKKITMNLSILYLYAISWILIFIICIFGYIFQPTSYGSSSKFLFIYFNISILFVFGVYFIFYLLSNFYFRFIHFYLLFFIVLIFLSLFLPFTESRSLYPYVGIYKNELIKKINGNWEYYQTYLAYFQGLRRIPDSSNFLCSIRNSENPLSIDFWEYNVKIPSDTSLKRGEAIKNLNLVDFPIGSCSFAFKTWGEVKTVSKRDFDLANNDVNGLYIGILPSRINNSFPTNCKNFQSIIKSFRNENINILKVFSCEI